MKILVTGGTGYIGSHTVVELQLLGHEAVIVDNLSNSSAGVVNRIGKITGEKPALYVVDLTDEAKTEKVFRENFNFDAVIHFAALKSVGESVQSPLKYYRNNVISTLNLLKMMTKYEIGRIVFSSSCTVYGQPDKLPVTEQTPLKRAESPYGNTKKVMEDIIFDVTRAKDIHAIALRYFNPIGAHESALIGEAPSDIPDNLVPYITQTATGKRPYLRVFGNDYNTPDGTPVRDYLHVTDLAKAHLAALNRMNEGKMKEKFEVFNLGTGKGYSVMDIISSFEKVAEMKLNYKVVARRPGDVEQIWADPTLANTELGWKAEKTLDEMLLSAWNWQKAK
ncbi:MAG TPA: UDP-glucose 4-epimerase GalE [Bacteroidales bacterium]|mgnify:CR=1 FL=1|nr:UDP-glucose 4-epimerase GalE [Bacteroidales bacterium]HPI85299.1 UDP-glucose 4-epimerase GalE [Bacteroidales bacterium]HPM92748.1 UDP-glucose 4-epimerase GalE [Bacteroidales bacterium]